MKKGSKIFVEGRLQTRDWEGKDGVKRYKTEIIADNLIMLDKKGEPQARYSADGAGDESPASAQAPRTQRSVKEPAMAEQMEEEEVSIDDLPF